jgi:hypothetical protein
MDTANKFDAENPVEPDPEYISWRWSGHGYRDYHHVPADEDDEARYGKYVTDWLALEAGEYYYLEGMALEWTGGDHHTVSVEFEKADT